METNVSEQSDITITKFGIYTIHGKISKVGYFTSSKVSSHLYYNSSMRYFFLVKFYQSEKCHIDFFNTYDPELNFLDNAYGKGEYFVAGSEEGYVKKELVYSYDTGKYSIKSHNECKNAFYDLLLKNC